MASITTRCRPHSPHVSHRKMQGVLHPRVLYPSVLMLFAIGLALVANQGCHSSTLFLGGTHPILLSCRLAILTTTKQGIRADDAQICGRMVCVLLGHDTDASVPGDLRHSRHCPGGGCAASESLLGVRGWVNAALVAVVAVSLPSVIIGAASAASAPLLPLLSMTMLLVREAPSRVPVLFISLYKYCVSPSSTSLPCPSILVPAVSLLRMLIHPMNAFPWVINGIVEAGVSKVRLEKLLLPPRATRSKEPFFHQSRGDDCAGRVARCGDRYSAVCACSLPLCAQHAHDERTERSASFKQASRARGSSGQKIVDGGEALLTETCCARKHSS